jgi:hypothetical protein
MTQFLPCSAHSKRSGKRCKQPAIPGGTVCRFHGGGAPQVIAKAQERLEANEARVREEFCRLAFADIRKAFNARGHFIKLHKLDEDLARAIASIEFGPNGRIDKIRFVDKKGALDSLARTLGMFKAEAVELKTPPEGLAVRVTFVESPPLPKEDE